MSRFIIRIQQTMYLGVEADSAIEAERLVESLNPRITAQLSRYNSEPPTTEALVDIELTKYLDPTVKPEVADSRKIKRFVRLCDSCGEWLGHPNQFRKHICEKCRPPRGEDNE